MTKSRSDVDERSARLDRLRLREASPDEPFDRLTWLLWRIMCAPISQFSLLDGERQYFRGAAELPEPWASCPEPPLSHSFCRFVVERGAAHGR